jgi:hypothetical protein
VIPEAGHDRSPVSRSERQVRPGVRQTWPRAPGPEHLVQSTCQFNTAHRPGGLFAAASVLLQALSWATVTLIVTGYTGIIRRT